MKLGIMSDSHDRLDMIERALAVFRGAEKVELIIHAGDFVAPFAASMIVGAGIPVRAVYGNNDGERRGLPRIVADIRREPYEFEIDGVRFVLAHDKSELAGVSGADCAIFGHTHRPHVEKRGARLELNPGETCGYLTGKATVAVLDTEEMDPRIIEL